MSNLSESFFGLGIATAFISLCAIAEHINPSKLTHEQRIPKESKEEFLHHESKSSYKESDVNPNGWKYTSRPV